MDQTSYNFKVQDMQSFCISAGIEYRVEADADLKLATFDVFYGEWRTIGSEYNPMTPECQRFYDEGADTRIRHEAGRDLAH